MRRRCRDPRTPQWPWYGGRGIKVCDDWSSYSAFRSWALTAGYAPGLSLDREDNDGHYEPTNCRWTTQTEQQRNRRTNVRLSAFGETKTMAEWSEDPRCAVGYTTLVNRVLQGWDHSRAISQPSLRRQKRERVTASERTRRLAAR